MRFSTKDIIKLTVPIILESLLGITIGMFDGIMVASEGEVAVSGVSLTNSLDIFLIMFFTSLAVGGGIVISQFFGKKDLEKSRETAKQLVYITLIIATVIAIPTLIFRSPLLHLIYGSVEPAVMQNAETYFLTLAISYPFLAINSSANAILRAQGRTKTTLFISIFGNAFNICGNAILIYGFNLGVLGAGIATLISRIISGFLGLLLCLKKQENGVYIDKLFRYKPSSALIKRICVIGIPNGLENSFFQLGKLLVASLISSFGTASIAANAVSQTLANFHWTVGGAIANGLSTVVGMCVGAGEKDEARSCVKKSLIFNYCCFAALSLFFSLGSGIFNHLYNLSAEASVLNTNITIINSIACITIWPLAFTLPNALRASSDVRFTMLVSIISMWVFRVCGSYLVSYLFGIGLYSIWVGMIVDWICRAIFFVARYKSGKWLTKYKE